MLADGFDDWGSLIESGLRKMRDRGQLAETADPKEMAIAILGAVQGGLLLAKTMRTVRPVELALDMALALVERSLAQQPLAQAGVPDMPESPPRGRVAGKRGSGKEHSSAREGYRTRQAALSER
jgi:hypothetical protein